MHAAHPSPLTVLASQDWDARLSVFQAGDEVATCVLTTRRYLIVVDTMATPALAHAIVAHVQPALEGRQLLVINTHADYDHCWGNAVFAAPDGPYPAPIIGHTLAAERLRGDAAMHELQRRQAEDARFAHVQLVPPTLTFTDGLHIDGGDLSLDLIPTPGHTLDHVAIWVPELRLLLAGDAAEDPFPCAANAVGLPLLRASLERLAQVKPEQVTLPWWSRHRHVAQPQSGLLRDAGAARAACAGRGAGARGLRGARGSG